MDWSMWNFAIYTLHSSPFQLNSLTLMCLLCLLTLLGEVGPEELPRVNTQDVGDLIGEDI